MYKAKEDTDCCTRQVEKNIKNIFQNMIFVMVQFLSECDICHLGKVRKKQKKTDKCQFTMYVCRPEK